MALRHLSTNGELLEKIIELIDLYQQRKGKYPSPTKMKFFLEEMAKEQGFTFDETRAHEIIEEGV